MNNSRENLPDFLFCSQLAIPLKGHYGRKVPNKAPASVITTGQQVLLPVLHT